LETLYNMVQQKRTYSQRDRKQREYVAQDAQRKRSKAGHEDELHLPTDRPTKRSALLKKGLKQHGGPISVPDDDDLDINLVPKKSKGLSGMFDKALTGKLEPITTKPHNIYGSRQDFEKSINDQSHAKESNARPKNGLPTPPSEDKKQQTDRFNRFVPGLAGAGRRSVFGGATPSVQSTETSQRFAKIIKVEQPKVSYVLKQYEADSASPPCRDLLGNRLSKKSPHAQLYVTTTCIDAHILLTETGGLRTRLSQDFCACLQSFAT
jgi:hypothetical protein